MAATQRGVVFRVTDKFGNTQQFSSGAVLFEIIGPSQIIGENPFGLVAGAGAIWIKTKQQPGSIKLIAKRQYLSIQTATTTVT